MSRKDEDLAEKAILDRELGASPQKVTVIGGFFFSPWVMWGGIAFGAYTVITAFKQLKK